MSIVHGMIKYKKEKKNRGGKKRKRKRKMQVTSVSPLARPTVYYYNNYYRNQDSNHCSRILPRRRRRRGSTLVCSRSRSHSNNKRLHTHHRETQPTPIHDNQQQQLYLEEKEEDEMYSFFGGGSSSSSNNKSKQLKFKQASEVSSKKSEKGEISSNMWWTNLKAKLGQGFNLEGIVSSMAVMTKDRHLAIPHISVRDIRCIDWKEMKRRGFRGVVFDKDNTLTAPYSLQLCPSLTSSFTSCKSVFGDNIAVFSNSAGLHQYDVDGSKARAIEDSIGVHVIRHGVKKPAGTAEDIEEYFGCEASLLVMVGDRYFTDVVYGNRNGFLTILTEPLSLLEEPFVVKQVRRLEATLVKYWYGKGLKPTSHSLLPEAMECIKAPPS